MTYQKTSQKNLRKTSKKLKFLEVPICVFADGMHIFKSTVDRLKSFSYYNEI